MNLENIKKELEKIKELSETEQINAVNDIKKLLNEACPIKEPVGNVQWIPEGKVFANDYNPNKVAPPEMELLEHSIREDGYTQPIVVFYDKENDIYIVVDGFHRNRIGKEKEDIKNRIKGHLPCVVIEKDIKERMASTIRHNRARGTHQIKSMANIVAELHFTGWSDIRIAKELGMEKDEILRLKQFTGLGNLFAAREYSNAWK